MVTQLLPEALEVPEVREIASDETEDQPGHARDSTLTAAEIDAEVEATKEAEHDPEAPLAPEAQAETLVVESTDTLIPLPTLTMVR